MSRRSARYSLDERENDALFEFENFKKKFLLANKHITKLNSTLSVRIEELNAQVAVLQAENLRLRESELAVSRQLKSEREKSRHIMLNAENAVHALTKHFGSMRVKFDVPLSAPPSSPSKHRSPKAKKAPARASPEEQAAPPTTSSSPPKERLAKIPDEPGIAEDDEPTENSPLSSRRPSKHVHLEATSSPPRAVPPPLPVISGPPSSDTPFKNDTTPAINSTSEKKKKPLRRQSAIFHSITSNDPLTAQSSSSTQIPESLRPASPSPMFGSPVKQAKKAGVPAYIEIDEDEDELDVLPRPPPRSKEKKRASSSSSSVPPSLDSDTADGVGRGRKISREPGLKLKDVTNSPHRKSSSSALRSDENVEPTPVPVVPALPPQPAIAARTFLAERNAGSSSSIMIPQKRPSSESPPMTDPFLGAATTSGLLDTPAPAGGRMTRTNRKSVNYAEPKLNTKMRKPDPTPEELAAKKAKRASAAAALPSQSSKKSSSKTTFGEEGLGIGVEKPRSSRGVNDGDDDVLFQAAKPRSAESSSKTADVERLPTKSSSLSSLKPKPSSSRLESQSPTPSPDSSPLPPSPPRARKSRPRLNAYHFEDEDYEDDGEEADEEFVPFTSREKVGSGVSGRRRTIGGGSTARKEKGGEVGVW